MWAPRGFLGSHPVGPGLGQHEAGAGFGSGSRGAGRDAGRAKRGESRGTGKARPGSPSGSIAFPRSFLSPFPPAAGAGGRGRRAGGTTGTGACGQQAAGTGTDGEREPSPTWWGRSCGARARPPLAALTPLPILGHPWPAVARLFGPGRTRGRSAAPVSPRLFSRLREGTVAAHIWAALGAAREQPPKGNAEGSAYRAGLGGDLCPAKWHGAP